MKVFFIIAFEFGSDNKVCFCCFDEQKQIWGGVSTNNKKTRRTFSDK